MDKTTIFWVSKFYYILMYIVQNKRGTYAPELIHGCVWQMQGLHMDFQIHIKAVSAQRETAVENGCL